MTYHHKDKSCEQETKSIVQNIFRSNSEEYHLTKTSETARFMHTSNSLPSEVDENILPNEASFDLDKDESVDMKSREAADCVTEEDLERYLPTHHVEFEASEAKEESEKKKGRRNYVEFRSDYRKI